MVDIDRVIHALFSARWNGDLSCGSIDEMKAHLHKGLCDQVNGYWSGHTSYHIMVDGGFLIDSKRIRIDGLNKCKGKKLTSIGNVFMESMK